jgi:ADP-ribose pyrophosphatase
MIVFSGRVFSVEVSTIRFPNGSEHTQEIVRHMPSVVIIPLLEDGRVLLVRQYRAAIARDTWELPAGSLNRGGAAEEAAARECEEEVRLAPHRLERIRGLFPAPGFCDEELIFFKAFDLRPPAPDSTRKPDEDEDIQTRAVTITDAKRMVARGEIVDLKTAYGLTLI